MTKKRPEVLTGKTIKIKTNCGSFYLTLNEHEGRLSEVRMQLGKSGNCVRNLLEVNGILLSIILQLGVEKEEVVNTIKKYFIGVNCGETFYVKSEKYQSCSDYVGQMILKELEKETKEEDKKKED